MGRAVWRLLLTPAIPDLGWARGRELLAVPAALCAVLHSGNITNGKSEPAAESDFLHCNQRAFVSHLNFLSAYSNSTTESSESSAVTN